MSTYKVVRYSLAIPLVFIALITLIPLFVWSAMKATVTAFQSDADSWKEFWYELKDDWLANF